MSEYPTRLCRDAFLLLAIGLLTVPGNARAAESYDNCSGFISALPATIAKPGTWCLKDNLSTAIASGAAVTVAADDVTIDCNDFTLDGLPAGSATQARGIHASKRANIVVRNCSIRGFRYGVMLEVGSGQVVEDNRLDSNLFVGIYVTGNSNRIQRNRVHDTGGRDHESYGIYAAADVIDNTVTHVSVTGSSPYARGIWMDGAGTVARENIVRNIVGGKLAGSAAGIQSNAEAIALIDNTVTVKTTTVGYGVIAGGLQTVCVGNTVINFTIDYFDCEAASHNLSL